jgi:signal transduction histidine kinase/CheY-like chemotaxis protein
MPSSILAKYSPESFFDENTPTAIADKKLKIIWYNNAFKENFKSSRLKGTSVDSLLKTAGYESEIQLPLTKSSNVHLENKNKGIYISPLFTTGNSNEPGGYRIDIVPTKKDFSLTDLKSSLDDGRSDFRNELNSILMLMVKETSIDILCEEILSKSIESYGGDFGLITFQDEGPNTRFQYYDEKRIISNKSEFEKTLNADFKFISKWLTLNKHSMITLSDDSNLGYNVTRASGCKTLIISPCIFNEKLIATLIIGKVEGQFSRDDVTIAEQFATLLTFTIINISTRNLNTALENRLQQAQKLETIGKLSSGMAHDFANLLSSIFGSVNLLRKRVELSEPVEKLIDNIENCSIRARDLTKGLLSFGKPTAKRRELVKPHLLLNEISKVITQTFPKTLLLNEEVDDNLYDIVGNATEIYQVFLNLCVNAKEATDGKGSISITAKNISIDSTSLPYFPSLTVGNYVQFSFKDDGVGIEENNLPKIFDPYFSTKSKDTGSGLGLYVTYGIIKAHNGFIDVTSQTGKGTNFDVYIPAFEPPKQIKSEPTEKIIMLVDDEPMLSELLAELLETSGYSVIKVSSGDDALKILTEEIKVDLAIIDYSMPDKSGLETIAKIRELKLDLPIILSSGSMWIDDETELSKYNINSQIQKPYEFETMLATIQELI